MVGLVAGAGVFAGLNTMYGAVVGRVKELATLQALGFRRRSIALSLIQEALLLAAAGSLIAAVLAVRVGQRSRRAFHDGGVPPAGRQRVGPGRMRHGPADGAARGHSAGGEGHANLSRPRVEISLKSVSTSMKGCTL